jgi:hypothetical protein
MMPAAMRALLPTHDSIQEFEKARHERLWDGVTLWVEGHQESAAGAVYLLGYSVEMVLKCAYFRVLGLRVSDLITSHELRSARAKAKLLGITTDAESYHSVQFWCDLLRTHRRAANDPLPPGVEQRLVAETAVVYDRWWVEMRYKANRATPPVLGRLLEAAEWFDRAYPELYT